MQFVKASNDSVNLEPSSPLDRRQASRQKPLQTALSCRTREPAFNHGAYDLGLRCVGVLRQPIVDLSRRAIAQDGDTGPGKVELSVILEEPQRRAMPFLDDFAMPQEHVEVVADGADGHARQSGQFAKA